MVELRDASGSLICKGDASTGLIEHIYKRCKTQTHLAIGGYIVIERDDIATKITRISTLHFQIERYALVA